MRYTIRLVGTVNGERTPHDGRYLVDYVPARMGADGNYFPEGALVTTVDIAEARRFVDQCAAFECWRQSAGLRPDGRPNRPLTAWTVDISPEPWYERV